MRKLEVILKLAEVCNIACDYCYYFFSGDDRPARRPAYIGDEVMEDLVRFLNDSYREGAFDEVQVDLHGGEPLMIGGARFDRRCEALTTRVEAPIRLCITTNAMLVDEAWIARLARWRVGVCVSIDGPADVHDRHRLDKRGRGTHARVIAGFDRLMAAARAGRIDMPAVLCVIDPEADGGRVYDYLVHELGVRSLDVLLPDRTWDSRSEDDPSVVPFVSAVMERWLADDDPAIHLRTMRSVLSLLVSGRSYLGGFGGSVPLAMTVGSDGEIDTDDFLKPCGTDVVATRRNIADARFADIFDDPAMVAVAEAIARVPDDCAGCAFRGACRGGQATHRYSAAHGFANRSIYCDAQLALFTRGARHLLATGVPVRTIADVCLAA